MGLVIEVEMSLDLDNLSPVSESEHHGSGPSIQLLGIVHGQSRHIVLGAL